MSVSQNLWEQGLAKVGFAYPCLSFWVEHFIL